MRLIAILLIILVAAAPGGVGAAGPHASSHCQAGETDFFSCRIKNSEKLVSLCGKPLYASDTSGPDPDAWLQYRFGALSKVELTYPSQKEGLLQRFVGEHLRPYDDAVDTVWFRHGSVTYGVELRDATHRFAGVWVQQGDKTTELSCSEWPRDPTPFRRLVLSLPDKPAADPVQGK